MLNTNDTETAQVTKQRPNDHYYKQLIPTTIQHVVSNIGQYSGHYLGVEIAGICFDIKQHNGYETAQLVEQNCKLNIRIPANVSITAAIKASDHDEFVKIIGKVKVHGQRNNAYIEVNKIEIFEKVEQILNHYLNVIYSKEYLANYDSIMNQIQASPQ